MFDHKLSIIIPWYDWISDDRDRMIVLAVKEGGPDPATNTMLNRYIKAGSSRICHDSGGGSTFHHIPKVTMGQHHQPIRNGGFTVIFLVTLVVAKSMLGWLHCWPQKKNWLLEVSTGGRWLSSEAALKDNLPKDTIDRRIKAFTASSATEGDVERFGDGEDLLVKIYWHRWNIDGLSMTVMNLHWWYLRIEMSIWHPNRSFWTK